MSAKNSRPRQPSSGVEKVMFLTGALMAAGTGAGIRHEHLGREAKKAALATPVKDIEDTAGHKQTLADMQAKKERARQEEARKLKAMSDDIKKGKYKSHDGLKIPYGFETPKEKVVKLSNPMRSAESASSATTQAKPEEVATSSRKIKETEIIPTNLYRHPRNAFDRMQVTIPGHNMEPEPLELEEDKLTNNAKANLKGSNLPNES